MKIKPDKINGLIEEMDRIITDLKKEEEEYREVIESVDPVYKKSARNLIHYHALRKHDLRPMQKKLRNLGMSRFNNATGHVLASIQNTQYILSRLIDVGKKKKKPGLSIKNGQKLLNNHTKKVLGYRSKKRRVRIMVTQPTEAAYNYSMVDEMVRNGMNCARINCAHDGPEVWKMIIDHVKKAAKNNKKRVTIAMDLGGPKIRTGTIEPGPEVRKFVPVRDEKGQVVKPAVVAFVEELTEESRSKEIPVGEGVLDSLSLGDKLTFTDARGKKRTLTVTNVLEGQVLSDCYDSAYVETGTEFHLNGKAFSALKVPPITQSIRVRVNDLLTVRKDQAYGRLARFDDTGELLQHAEITCQYQELFDQIEPGQHIYFDDGKIEGVVLETEASFFSVRIIKAKAQGSKLKAEKGINLPDTKLETCGLTHKDKEDLAFVAEHADVVNYSFVNTASDVELLIEELEKLGVNGKLNVLLKIETQQAFDNLKDILLTAMKTHFIGVMIARGDLAVETGWDKIGWVQREILYTCNSAHIPVVWATQVLENLAKKGLPSRSEITDATTSLKAECVMLNKGPYINEAIHLLDHILSGMEEYHEKNENMLPKRKKLMVNRSAARF